MRRALILLALATVASSRAHAQRLADRVAATRDGTVSFHFASRDGVCGDGEQVVRIGSSYFGSWTGARTAPCVSGPVQVTLTLRGGDVERVQTTVGTPRARGGANLGAVPSAEAARYLTDLAARGRAGASTRAILPAVLADSAVVWPALLTIARDAETRSRNTRQEALFWLSRFASGATRGHKNDPMDDEDHGDDLKSHAVFVLSQLPHGSGIPELLEVARTNHDPQVRGRALFWLGQSGDPRALALFETLLQ